MAAYGILWMEVDRDAVSRPPVVWFGEYAELHGGAELAVVIGLLPIWVLVGVVAWKVLIIAWETARLSRSFMFEVVLGHPDKSGGFADLGYMCFRLALIITMPSVLCAFWVAVLGGEITSSLLRERYETWESNFRVVLGVLIVLTFLVAVRPLRGVHKGMQRGRRGVQRDLDAIAVRMGNKARSLLSDTPRLEVAEIEDRSTQIEVDQKLISDMSRFPTWPFDRATVAKLSASQVVPVLTLLGVSGPFVDSIKGLFPLIGGPIG